MSYNFRQRCECFKKYFNDLIKYFSWIFRTFLSPGQLHILHKNVKYVAKLYVLYFYITKHVVRLNAFYPSKAIVFDCKKVTNKVRKFNQS